MPAARQQDKSAHKQKYCTASQCKQTAITDGYCRLHYLSAWQERKKSGQIDAEEKLNRYIEKLADTYPDNYLEILRKDLSEREDLSSLMKSLESERDEHPHSDDELFEIIKKIKTD